MGRGGPHGDRRGLGDRVVGAADREGMVRGVGGGWAFEEWGMGILRCGYVFWTVAGRVANSYVVH